MALLSPLLPAALQDSQLPHGHMNSPLPPRNGTYSLKCFPFTIQLVLPHFCRLDSIIAVLLLSLLLPL